MVSQNKLGYVGYVPVVPVMPTAAQMNPKSGTLHLRLGDTLAYVNARLPSVAPSRIPEVRAALIACPTEPSWSNSGSLYAAFTVVPSADGTRAEIKAGEVLIGYVLVDGSHEIVSGDESIASQIHAAEKAQKKADKAAGGGGADLDDDGDDDDDPDA